MENKLPSAILAEKSVIGDCLFNPTRNLEIVSRMMPTIEVIYNPTNRAILADMLAMANEGKHIDSLSLMHRLNGKLEVAGGLGYLDECSELASDNVERRFTDEIIPTYHQRQLSDLLANSLLDLYNGTSAQAITTKLVDSLYQSQVAKKGGLESPQALFTDAYIDELKQHFMNPFGVGLPTGFPTLDRKFIRLAPSEFTVIAARPHIGKTTFALDMAYFNAIHHKKRVAVFELEMVSKKLWLQLLKKTGKTTGDKTEDWKTMLRMLNYVKTNNNLYINDNPISISQALLQARQMAFNGGLDLIIIDYLQLAETSNKYRGNRAAEVSEISRGCKNLAMELDVPVIACAQLNREIEKRVDGEPQLSDLKDSGSIEQDADNVIFLHQKSKDDSKRKVIIAKNRYSGNLGCFDTDYQHDYQRFVEIESNMQLVPSNYH